MNFVSDTHALLWCFTNSPKLSSKASEIFEKCEKGEAIIFIPSIVIAESLSIFEKKRVLFPILQKMVTMKEVPELHDKIIASTAKYLKLPIISKDKVLQELPSIKTIW